MPWRAVRLNPRLAVAVCHPPRCPQAALPFKSKPKVEGKRKRKTLEQKRAVVLEPEERKKVWGGVVGGERGGEDVG